ncbi:amidohydrolase [Rhizobium sp. KVB221]|uniref:Amidohydrolase n=1 Tax=Rhizobium setariae TaxID=2801340 RepID=A0A936YWF7_9HYPH|nr:amidohydrolase [Rhizobium setariae]MBL0375526.1 amidohydrolase [Rhizobium setariae]
MSNVLGYDQVAVFADAKAADYAALSDRIWDMPELAFEEFRSVAEHIEIMEKEGFHITRNIAGIETAFIAEWGQAGPVIGFLGEFDALAGLSQDADTLEAATATPGANGHGCHHNLLGAASLLAAVALRDAVAAAGVQAKIRYYGCPAEEEGSGKTFMARAGAFDDLDAAFCWHPASFNAVMSSSTLAVVDVNARFTGRSAHAAMAPHVGRSALDAVELMNVGINYMREHMPSDARIHYAITDAGGKAANVVQARAEGTYVIRAPELSELTTLLKRVEKIAQGAALMTETTVETTVGSAMANIVPNRTLESAMYQNLKRCGPPPYDAEDFAYADRMRQSALSEEDIIASAKSFGGDPDFPRSLHDDILPFPETPGLLFGSTDVGDVSWIAPTAQCLMATVAIGTPFHAWQTVAQGKRPAAHKAMIVAAKVMAATGADVISDPAMLKQAKDELKKRTRGQDYLTLIPESLRSQ